MSAPSSPPSSVPSLQYSLPSVFPLSGFSLQCSLQCSFPPVFPPSSAPSSVLFLQFSLQCSLPPVFPPVLLPSFRHYIIRSHTKVSQLCWAANYDFCTCRVTVFNFTLLLDSQNCQLKCFLFGFFNLKSALDERRVKRIGTYFLLWDLT